MKILIAEDTTDLNRVITAMLKHAGYDVDSVFDGEAALEQIDKTGYDAVILDIMMPKKDGISVLQTIRTSNITVPVLLLTAKAEVDDRVAGLNAGADDYLPKPFAMKELLARINAMTRRRIRYETSIVNYMDFSLDTETLELAAQSSVRLSMKEGELLQLLVLHAEKPLETGFILEHVWNHEPGAGEDTVHLYIRYLRRKLDAVSSCARIEGERGQSYCLKPQ